MDGWETTFWDAAYVHVLLLLVSGRVPTLQPSCHPVFVGKSLPQKKTSPNPGNPQLFAPSAWTVLLVHSQLLRIWIQVSPGIFPPEGKGCIIAGLRLKENPMGFPKPSDHKAASYFWGGGWSVMRLGLANGGERWWFFPSHGVPIRKKITLDLKQTYPSIERLDVSHCYLTFLWGSVTA